jgi:hypothetical protein
MRQTMTPTERRRTRVAAAVVWGAILAVLVYAMGPAVLVGAAVLAAIIGLTWLTCAAWTGEWYP